MTSIDQQLQSYLPKNQPEIIIVRDCKDFDNKPDDLQ